MKTLDSPQSPGARDCHDVFPFLITLSYFKRNHLIVAIYAAVFINDPHTNYSIYYIKYILLKNLCFNFKQFVLGWM